jgi:enterochelin esterase-like enzyme
MGVSLQGGWLSWLLMILGLAAFAFLLIRPLRWWWVYVVPAVVVVSALGGWIVGELLGPEISDKPLEGIIDFWLATIIAGVLLAIGHQFRSPVWEKLVAVLAVLVVVFAAANQMNKHFVQYPTLGDVFGVASDDSIDGPPVITTSPTSPPLPPGPLTQTWTPTGANIPADGRGRTSPIDLPGTVSGFPARQGVAYYPPAYFADNPEPLPVLILMAGQPGNPGDFFLGDRIPNVMNDFAKEHNGIAPVVVVPDPLSAETGNPLCADAWEGNAMTYLTKDVPDGIKKQLRVTQDTKTWVIGGWSNGGTCAFQLTTNHPEIYPNFIDISGEYEQNLGNHEQTVNQGFGGDEAKFAAINPPDLLKKNKYPTVSGWFIWGSTETDADIGVKRLIPLAQAAGMDVQQYEVQGSGHDWATVVAGITHTMPWMAQKMGLTS